MSEAPDVLLWCGKDIETLSRDELILALRCAAEQQRSIMQAWKSTIEIRELAAVRRRA